MSVLREVRVTRAIHVAYAERIHKSDDLLTSDPSFRDHLFTGTFFPR